jgi:hypothetical protein
MAFRLVRSEELNDIALAKLRKDVPDTPGGGWQYEDRAAAGLDDLENAGWSVVSVTWTEAGEIEAVLLHTSAGKGNAEPMVAWGAKS